MTSTDTARTAIIDTATTYLDALVSHDAASVRLADDVRRIGNGKDVVSGADALRAVIQREPVGAVDALRWVVDGDTAALVYDLDADLTRSEQSETFGPRESWITSFIAERFTVVDGLISEIEVVYAGSEAGRARAPRPERYPRTIGADAPSRQSVIDAASAYLAALVSHDGSDVPLAPNAWRVENGRNSGHTGPEIASALGIEIMHVITGVRDEQWFVEDDTAVVFYTIDVDLGRLPGADAGAPKSAKRLGERFRVHRGQITEIEAVVPATDI
jgi:hypothetical protein